MIITSSRLKAFHDCQRLHHIQYVQGYRPVNDSEPLTFGTLMHLGLETWWNSFPGLASYALERALERLRESCFDLNLDAATLDRAELLMIGYDARWSADMAGLEVLAVERTFETPVRRMRGVRLAGKMDVIVRKLADGTVWVVEHKTTTADITPGAGYWSRLRLDSQISVYIDGATSLGYEVAGCIYDVIKKPELRPYKATPAESRKYTKDGALYANQRAEDEAPDAFQARIAEHIAANPDAYFARAEVVRLDTEIEAARYDVAETARQIQALGSKPGARNTSHCFAYGGRACPFADHCAGAASLDDASRFKKIADINPELANEVA